MTDPPQPTEHLHQEPGDPLRRATAVASRDGDLVAYDPGKVVELAGRVPTSRLFDDDLTGRSPKRWWTPRPTATRHSSPTRWPAEPGAAAASTRPASSCCLAGRDEGGFMVEHVMELLAAS